VPLLDTEAPLAGLFHSEVTLCFGHYALRGAGDIEQVGRGLYRLSTAPPFQARSGSNRDSHFTRCSLPYSALAHHGLTTQVPHAIDISLPSHANVPGDLTRLVDEIEPFLLPVLSKFAADNPFKAHWETAWTLGMRIRHQAKHTLGHLRIDIALHVGQSGPAAHQVLAPFLPQVFVSRFVSTRVQSHAFSTIFRSLGGSQKMPGKGRKREK
jgi:hypothetical protein